MPASTASNTQRSEPKCPVTSNQYPEHNISRERTPQFNIREYFQISGNTEMYLGSWYFRNTENCFLQLHNISTDTERQLGLILKVSRNTAVSSGQLCIICYVFIFKIQSCIQSSQKWEIGFGLWFGDAGLG